MANLQLVPLTDSNDSQRRTLIATNLNEVIKGRQNNLGTVTLSAGVTTTTVTDTRIKLSMFIFLQAITANAAGAVANTYVSAVADGSFTLTHANTATMDRTFWYIFHG